MWSHIPAFLFGLVWNIPLRPILDEKDLQHSKSHIFSFGQNFLDRDRTPSIIWRIIGPELLIWQYEGLLSTHMVMMYFVQLIGPICLTFYRIVSTKFDYYIQGQAIDEYLSDVTISDTRIGESASANVGSNTIIAPDRDPKLSGFSDSNGSELPNPLWLKHRDVYDHFRNMLLIAVLAGRGVVIFGMIFLWKPSTVSVTVRGRRVSAGNRPRNLRLETLIPERDLRRESSL